MTKRRIPYPEGAPLNAGGYPAFDSNGRSTPWTHYRAENYRQRLGKSARAIRLEQERAAARARVAAEAAALRAHVQPAFKPPPGRFFGVDVPGQMLIGPSGGIGTTPLLARTMALLSAPGRHLPDALLPAGWRDLEDLQEGLEAFAGKLGALGLVLNRRSTGLRITKV